MPPRPNETCWKAEIVHSCPRTVLAPISHSPSCTRIFVPWPIHDQRPSLSVASRPISSLTLGPTKHRPSVCRRLPQRSFRNAQRAISRAYLRLSIPWARRNRASATGPPCSGAGTPWISGVAADLDTVTISTPRLSSRADVGSRGTAAERGQARAGARDLPRRGRRSGGLGAREGGLPEDRRGVGRGLHRAARRGQVDPDRRIDPRAARPGPAGRGAVDRSVL